MAETDCIKHSGVSPPSLTKQRKERISRFMTPRKLKKVRQETFLRKLAETGSVSQSASHAGINVCTPYDWCQSDPNFKQAMELSRSSGEKAALAVLEEEIQRRTLSGKEDPGSTKLLMFRTKRLDPAYRDNAQVNMMGHGPVAIVFGVTESGSAEK